tara:strand:+ start:206 stop:622 length:417 start_codon:yes stop_codon:yes gene_type:complete
METPTQPNIIIDNDIVKFKNPTQDLITATSNRVPYLYTNNTLIIPADCYEIMQKEYGQQFLESNCGEVTYPTPLLQEAIDVLTDLVFDDILDGNSTGSDYNRMKVEDIRKLRKVINGNYSLMLPRDKRVITFIDELHS